MQPPNIHGTRWPGCSSQAPVLTKFQPSIFGLQLFKGRQSKIDLEASSILYLVPCCGSLHICTNMGLRGSEPTKTLWPPLCAYLWVTHGKTKLVSVPGHLPWPLSQVPQGSPAASAGGTAVCWQCIYTSEGSFTLCEYLKPWRIIFIDYYLLSAGSRGT